MIKTIEDLNRECIALDSEIEAYNDEITVVMIKIKQCEDKKNLLLSSVYPNNNIRKSQLKKGGTITKLRV
ncbi:MAG: hypothetical protein KAH20_13210 [Methylococcales bacterium]|nr:hypothetical protein [Methylococcales bacterium]